MKRLISSILCIFAVLPAWAADPSLTREVKRRTHAGEAVIVRTHAMWNHDCSVSALPTINIKTQPTQGQIELRNVDVIAGENLFGVDECEGQKVRGVQVVYTPSAGARGKDSLSYEVDYRKAKENQRINAVINIE